MHFLTLSVYGLNADHPFCIILVHQQILVAGAIMLARIYVEFAICIDIYPIVHTFIVAIIILLRALLLLLCLLLF